MKYVILSGIAFPSLYVYSASAGSKLPASAAEELPFSGQLPLIFERNQGQTGRGVQFVGANKDYVVLLREHGFNLRPRAGSQIKFRLVGSRKAHSIVARNPTGGVSNYFLGSDRRKWQVGIPNFAGVEYKGIYSGIDMVFRGSNGQLEYDFFVAPSADAARIRLEITGTSGLSLDSEGNLLLHTQSGVLRQAKPGVYQENQGKRVRLNAEYVVSRPNFVDIRLSLYDHSKPLLIDPVISYSATLATWGGSTAVALDPSGNVYVLNSSTPQPPTLGMVTVTKLDPTLTTVIYSTSFGPGNGSGIAVDSSGSVYVTGYTNSASFPTTAGAYQRNHSPQPGQSDAFVAKLNPSGQIVYSTFLGGNGEDQGNCIAIDSTGSAYVSGWTLSSDFPTTPGAYQSANGGGAFVAKFTPDGSGLSYSTTIGQFGTVFGSIVLDASHNAYLAGVTHANLLGSNDAYVAKLNPTGSNLVLSKVIGGSANDLANSMVLDNLGYAYITGTTSSADFPTTPNAFQPHYGGGPSDAFALKLSPDGTTILYSTYLGGSGDDRGAVIAVDSGGNVILGGSTNSTDFPTSNALQAINATLYLGNASTTAYVAKLDASGSRSVFSSYLGGHIGEDVRAMALDQSGNAYVTGVTGSPDFPVTPGTLQTSIGPSGADTFLTKITDPTTCTFSISASQPSDAGGSVFVTAPPGCFWYGEKKDSWVTFGPTTSGSGNGTVTYTLTPNSGPARTATVSIAGQGVNFMQASTCTYQLNQVPGFPGTAGFLSVITQFGCTWTVTSNTSWLTVSPSGVQTGSLGVTFIATTNPGLQPRVGTVTFNGIDSHVIQTLQITQSVASTTMTLAPYALNFAISGPIVSGPQFITLTFSGPAQPAWTASCNLPNVTISPTSGIGSALIKVTVSGQINTPPPNGTCVDIEAPSVSVGRVIPLNIFNAANGPPFGNFDTPTDNASGVAGAIPVTGWALDNIEVSKVDIWREPVGSEPVSALMYIGDATFVEGARPDLPPKFPNTPFNTRGGWGYMLLTNYLPNNNGGTGGLGNGTYKLHAIAHNKAGISLDLGTKTIIVDNMHASKPFGTIDTPPQGGTINGNAYVNFGWALAQKPYVIPTDGSTITVFLDGMPVGHPNYNQFRNDIATLFPGFANSNGAVGFFYIDTTALTNGVHSIAWSVTDNQGRSEGIGSRYFNVINGANTVPANQNTLTFFPEHAFTLLKGVDPAESRLEPEDGTLNVEIEELERLQLQLGAYEGYLRMEGIEQRLPIGSTLRDGVFYWQPGLGFLGDYEMIFRRMVFPDLKLKVSIQPKRFASRPTQSASPDR